MRQETLGELGRVMRAHKVFGDVVRAELGRCEDASSERQTMCLRFTLRGAAAESHSPCNSRHKSAIEALDTIMGHDSSSMAPQPHLRPSNSL